MTLTFIPQALQTHTITDHFVSTNHPFFGVRASHCHTLLKRSNWQQKGIREGADYIFVSQAFQARTRIKGFSVNHWCIDSGRFISQSFVTELNLALVLANSLAQGLRMSRYKHPLAA